MSTNRNISTLPLDALRSVTLQQEMASENKDQRPPSRNNDRSFSHIISDKNLQLRVENRKLRRCMALFMENSSLKAANVLASVLSMSDNRLRQFMTEKILDPRINLEAIDFKAQSDAPQLLQQPNDASTSYGMSFQNIDLNDLQSHSYRSYDDSYMKSTRRSHSPVSPSRSIRPPMRFGVGKSPYSKSPDRSPTGHSFSTKFNNSTIEQGQGQQSLQSRSKSIESKSGKYSRDSNSLLGEVTYDKSINKRASSAPPIKRLVFDNGQFKVNENSAFSQVKSRQPCRDCSLRFCSLHHARPEKDSTTINSSSNNESLPVFIDAKPQLRSVKYNRSPVSDYQTAQHLLYDAQDGLYNENQSNQPQIPTDRKIKRHLAKSVNLTRTPQELSDNTLQTENVKGNPDTSAMAQEDHNRSTQPSFRDEDMTLSELHGRTDLDRKSVRSDLNHVEDSSSKSSKPTQVPVHVNSSGTCVDRPEDIGTPQASSTPLPANKPHHDIQSQANILSSDSLAYIMGIKGPGALEKAIYVLHRPLDVLIGYYPRIPKGIFSSLSMSKPNMRIIGEIAFQLDRRILEYVFSVTDDKQNNKRRSRYYGYSVSSIRMLIRKEVQRSGNDPDLDSYLRARLDHIVKALQPLKFDVEYHPEFTQNIVNKYGLLNGTPKPGTIEETALSEPAVMRLLVGQLLKDDVERDHMLIILDCLQFMAHHDKGPFFIW